MRRPAVLAFLFLPLFLLFLAVEVLAAESPVFLTHSRAGASAVADVMTIDLVLRVDNPGDAPIKGLAVSHIPLLLVGTQDIHLDIGSIGARESRDIPFQLVIPLASPDDVPPTAALFWSGTCLDAGGNTSEFPATSREEVVP